MNKENVMKKYSIRQSIMYDLKNWKEKQRIGVDNDAVVSWEDFKNLPDCVLNWQLNTGSAVEANNRLIAIIKWLNGEDVFEVENQVYAVRVRSDNPPYVREFLKITDDDNFMIVNGIYKASKFDDFEKANAWSNEYFEVVEVDE